MKQSTAFIYTAAATLLFSFSAFQTTASEPVMPSPPPIRLPRQWPRHVKAGIIELRRAA